MIPILLYYYYIFTKIHNSYFCFKEYPVDNYILANAFKAIVGALLRSSGEENAAYFVRDFVITQLQGKFSILL